MPGPYRHLARLVLTLLREVHNDERPRQSPSIMAVKAEGVRGNTLQLGGGRVGEVVGDGELANVLMHPSSQQQGQT